MNTTLFLLSCIPLLCALNLSAMELWEIQQQIQQQQAIQEHLRIAQEAHQAHLQQVHQEHQKKQEQEKKAAEERRRRDGR